MITFWVADPHDLHFILVVGKPDVNLFVPWTIPYLNFGYFDQLLQSYETIFIQIDELEGFSYILNSYVGFRLHYPEVFYKLI